MRARSTARPSPGPPRRPPYPSRPADTLLETTPIMKTRAAVLSGIGQPFEIIEFYLDHPRPREVPIKFTAAGPCPSDPTLSDGSLPPRFPIVGGHEGAGVIEAVGPGVTKVEPGDHVVCSFIPNCGTCRYCSTGRQSLCDMGATILDGHMPDGTFRFHSG